MEHRFISIGAACSPAEILKRLGLRHSSYPFDWLWNLDSGMSAVCAMIRDNFTSVTAQEAYSRMVPPLLGFETTVYRAHPAVLHVHSNPLVDASAHQELVRRFARFREALQSNDTLHFIYFRSLTTSRRINPELTAADLVRQLLAEGIHFLTVVERAAETRLLLVLEADVEDAEAASVAVARAAMPDHRLSLATTLSRYEGDKHLNRRWLWEWSWVVIRSEGMPLRLAARAAAKTLFRFTRYAVRDAVNAVVASVCRAERGDQPQSR